MGHGVGPLLRGAEDAVLQIEHDETYQRQDAARREVDQNPAGRLRRALVVALHPAGRGWSPRSRAPARRPRARPRGEARRLELGVARGHTRLAGVWWLAAAAASAAEAAALPAAAAAAPSREEVRRLEAVARSLAEGARRLEAAARSLAEGAPSPAQAGPLAAARAWLEGAPNVAGGEGRRGGRRDRWLPRAWLGERDGQVPGRIGVRRRSRPWLGPRVDGMGTRQPWARLVTVCHWRPRFLW